VSLESEIKEIEVTLSRAMSRAINHSNGLAAAAVGRDILAYLDSAEKGP
jgi:hypothetical protein